MTSIDIWQAINSTPFSKACWRRDSNESIPFLFMIYRIIFPPIPPMLIFESFSFPELEGSIIPNIFPKISFSVFGLCNFLITFSPQNVKKIVTFCPVAAAPFASTKVAKALSKSSLNMMKVFPLLSQEVTMLHDFGSPFSITITDFPPEDSFETSWLPVELHHAAASRGNPGSVAVISTRSPGASMSIVFFIFKIGPGHCRPQASTRIVLAVSTGATGLLAWTVASCRTVVSSVSLSFSSCIMIGAVAARYVFSPPDRLRTFSNPCCVSIR